MSSANLQIRVDPALKEEAAKTFNALGLTMSEAVRIFLARSVAEGGIPFEMKIPNAETQAAMEESRAMIRADRARSLTRKSYA